MTRDSLGQEMRDAWDRNTPIYELPARVNLAFGAILLGVVAVVAILIMVLW